MIPCLYDSREMKFDHNGIGKLADAQSCTVTEKRNGSYHITIYVQRLFHLHRPPSSVLCLHMHGCNISVPDHTGAGRKTPCRTPDRSLIARSSSSLVSGGCCSTVTGIPVSRTSVVCLYGLVRLPYRTEGRRKKPCP